VHFFVFVHCGFVNRFFIDAELAWIFLSLGVSPVDEALPATVLGTLAFNVVFCLQRHPPAILLL
jgi:hypothetical protein